MNKELTVYDKATEAARAILKDKSFISMFGKRKKAPLDLAAERHYVEVLIGRSEFLADTVASNPMSLITAMLDAATLGVSLSPTLSHAYLIPEKVSNKYTVTLSVSYRGLESLVLKSKAVRAIDTELVYSNDTFERGNRDGTPFVNFSMARGERGTLEGSFCMSKLANGELHVEWMDAAELEGCHQAAIAKQKRDPITWRGPFKGEMYKKCVVRRAAKHWVLPDRLVEVLQNIERLDPMEFNANPVQESPAIQVITQGHLRDIRESLNAMGMEDAAINIWLNMQTQAWGHSGIEAYPDDGWEKLRDKLIERRHTVEKLQQERLQKQAEAAQETVHAGD